jgi:ribosomal 30S subunit maturation factor RimM
MTDIWIYRLDVFKPEDPAEGLFDLTGFEVATTDGEKIGKLHEASNDSGSAWIVVDTGFWIFGKKRMIPAGAVESVDSDEQLVRVALSKDELKEAPDYEKAREFEESYRQEMGDYYGKRRTASTR